jgi:hypothetical protein
VEKLGSGVGFEAKIRSDVMNGLRSQIAALDDLALPIRKFADALA